MPPPPIVAGVDPNTRKCYPRQRVRTTIEDILYPVIHNTRNRFIFFPRRSLTLKRKQKKKPKMSLLLAADKIKIEPNRRYGV